jgi:DNA-binding NarL/FixJ family response regulator
MDPVTPGVRVLLVDEHEVVRRGVVGMLADDAGIAVVGEAGSVREALARGPAVRPDVGIVGMRLPDGSGAEVCARLSDLVPGVRFLVLSRYSDPETVQAAVRAGAAGYLIKRVRGPALAAAIRKVASGGTVFDREARAALSVPSTGDKGDRLAVLTPQERTVLRLIGEGLSNRQIGDQMGLAEKTVKNYTSQVLAKLHLTNRTQAAILAVELPDNETAGGS